MKIARALLIIFSYLGLSCEKSEKHPNVILIMADDLGWFDVGFNGNTEIQTPALDKLANNGLIFNRFYSASTVCSPTRASVLTGRHPHRLKVYGANTGHMIKEEITLAEILKNQGYATGHFGKWHLGTLTKDVMDANRGGREESLEHYTLPIEHGYDTFFSTESKVPTYDPMIVPDSFEVGESWRYGWKAVENRPTKYFGTAYWTGEKQKVTENLEGSNSEIIMDRVIPFIENSVKNQNPFFSTIWLHTPHLPVVSDKEHRSMFSEFDLEKQLYYGSIRAMDEQIDRLWNSLEEQGIADETIIFFCSDNGPEVITPGTAGKLRGKKRDLYEGGVRVPSFVVWKNNIEGNRRTDFPSLTSDYLPTMLNILDLEYPDYRPLDGIDIWDVIQGKETARNSGIGFVYKDKKSWVTDEHKLITTDGENYELYNLITDASESRNIILEHPEFANQMKTDLNKWLQSVENSEKGLDY